MKEHCKPEKSHIWALVYFTVPKIISPNFGDFLNKSSGINIIKCRKYIFLLAFKVVTGRVREGDARLVR